MSDSPPGERRNPAKALSESVETLCFAIDMLIGKLQKVVWMAVVMLCLSTLSPVAVVWILQGQQEDVRQTVEREAAEIKRHADGPKIDLRADPYGGAVLRIETEEDEPEDVDIPPDELPTKPEVPKPRRKKVLEMPVDLDAARVKEEQ